MQDRRLFLPVVLLAACSRGETLRIVQAQVLDATNCTVTATPTGKQLSFGTLDLALPNMQPPPYQLPLVVANMLGSTSGSTTFDPNDVTVTHFTVELSAPHVTWSNTCPATFDTATISYRLAPQATAGFSLNALTPSHAWCLSDYVNYTAADALLVTATVRAKGVHRGSAIASDPFVFPITVCAGCLQRGYDNPAFIRYQYPADIPLCDSLAGPNPYPGNPCNPGQDDLILCCGVLTNINGTKQATIVCPGVLTGIAAPDASVPVDS